MLHKITPSEALVEVLAAHKVEYVFGIVGSAYMDALDIFEGAGIKFIPVAHEQGAAHMADGYARISHKHGVCIAQNGPGITNFVTAIAAAYWAHSPVVAITPETGSKGIGLGGFQETNQLPIFSDITTFQTHVNRPDRMAELAHRAFTLAKFERGPVQINIPRDYFYGEIDTELRKPQEIELGFGGEKSIQKAVEIISQAKNPVIISGGGVGMAKAVKEIETLAEFLSAPVVTSYLHNDCFSCQHPLMCGSLGYYGSRAGMEMIHKADVILALGTRLGPFGTLPQYEFDYWPKQAKTIQVDSNHRVLGLVREVEVGILGDVKLAAVEMLKRLREKNNIACLSSKEQRLNALNQAKQNWEAQLDKESQVDTRPMAPKRALRELEKAMPSNAIISTDIGNICSVANSYLRFNKPDSFLAAMSFGNCGYAFPVAIGAKIAAPDRPAIAYVGDGAWGISLNETITCVRQNIPVVVCLFNNKQWGAEKKNQIDYYGDRYVGSNLDNPSFTEIAKATGANAMNVDAPDQVGDALKEAIASNRPTILEIQVSRELGEPFRRDALKKPMRLLEKYKKYIHHN